MNLQELLKESVQPEQAELIESAIAQAVDTLVEQKLAEAAKDAATAQAQVAQKSADEIENISATYDSEMKKAAKQVAELEKFYNQQINIAVDKIVTAYDDAERQSSHYEGQLKEAAEMFIKETDSGSLSEAREQIAAYVEENARLIEQGQKFGEYGFQEGLAEAQGLVEEATARFIQEKKAEFDRLDEMARLEKIVSSIKEAYELNALGLSEDSAYQELQESVEAKETEITSLQESIDKLKAELFENQKAAEFDRLTKNLSEAQKDKLKDVSEAIIAENVETFSRTLGFLVEAQSTNVKDTKSLTENMQDDETLNTNVQKTINESKNTDTFQDDFVKSIVAKMK